MPAQRAAYFTQTLLPSLPTDRQLLVGGDFNCVAGQLDVLGPDSTVLGRTTGYYDGLRIAETDRQLFDIWRDRFPDRQTFTHASSQSSARLDRWLVSEQLRRWISTAPDTLDQTAGYPGDYQGVALSASQLQAARTLAEQLGACRYPSSTTRASAQRQQMSSQHISRTTHFSGPQPRSALGASQAALALAGHRSGAAQSSGTERSRQTSSLT